MAVFDSAWEMSEEDVTETASLSEVRITEQFCWVIAQDTCGENTEK